METTWRIYSYEDSENKVAYVGLTKQSLRKRHNGHKHSKKSPTVKNYFKSVGKDIPYPIEKMEVSTAEDAQYYEDWYKKAYASAGWNVLNKAKTGIGSSSLGNDNGIPVIWTYETCFNAAKECKMKVDFQKKYPQGYCIARIHGWLKDYVWFKHPRKDMGYWDYEHCKEEAKKYRTRKEFRDGCARAYSVALNNKWIDDYGWFENGRVKWTYDKCYEEAKKYMSRTQFYDKSKGAYDAAKREGWLDDYNWFLSEHEARIAGNLNQWKNRTIAINQYSLDGEFIKTWNSSMEAAKSLGKTHGNICSCCKGKRKYAYGYIWKYAA